MNKRFNEISSRRRLIAASAIILALALLAGQAHAKTLDEGRWNFNQFYEYDKAAPLNVEQKVVRETDKYTLYHWTFDSTHGKRVPALFAVPKGAKSPMPAVLFLHGYSGNKGDMESALDSLCASGYAGLSLDAEYHGERAIPGKNIYSKMQYSDRDAMVQTVVDYRRAIDALETRPEIDAKRIGFVGGSMGGILGAVLSAVEPRIRATALVVGGADWTYLMKYSVVSQALGLMNGDNPLTAKGFGDAIAVADPINWAQQISPRAIIMFNGKQDLLVNPEANKKLFARLKPPKKIVWFDSGHGLPFDIVLSKTVDFFNDYLKGDKAPATLGETVEAYKTEPPNMKLKSPLPAIRTDMPLAELFRYESFLPLNPTAEKVADEQYPDHYKVSFLSVHDKTVSGDLYLPAAPAKRPFPAIVYLHEPFGDPSEARALLPAMFARGYAVLAIDLTLGAPFSNPDQFLTYPYALRDAVIQLIFDVRRGCDFLATRPDIALTGPDAPGGVTVVVRDITAVVAVPAAALDQRIRNVVYIEGSGKNNPLKALADEGENKEAAEESLKNAEEVNLNDVIDWHSYLAGEYNNNSAIHSYVVGGTFSAPGMEFDSILDFLNIDKNISRAASLEEALDALKR